MKVLARAVLGVAAALALVAAVVAFRLARSVPPLAGRETLPGLLADVEVIWDSLAVPHITARSDADAFIALGYLHARERLWQMEIMRRAAEGRLAEILGPSALTSDRFLRNLDIPHAAALSLQRARAESRAVAEAYAAGVNRWIAHHTRPLGPEFQLLRFRPEPWTALHSFEISRLLAWDLVNANVELELARVRARLGEPRARELFPAYPEDAPVILPRGSGSWVARTGARTHRRADAPTHRRLAGDLTGARGAPGSTSLPASWRLDSSSIPPLAAQLLEGASIARASNSWVVGPALSRSGKPILANDPHLALRAPALWYLAAIESPRYAVAGATIPGLPCVVIGHNSRIAWGLTNVGVDDVDYVIELMSRDSSKVMTPRGWVPVTIVRDAIRVRGRAAVPFVLRRTAHGPIVGENPGGFERTALAMRWTAHEPSDEVAAMLGVNRAGSWAEFREALRGFLAPEQNWIYADVDGNIGYQMTGRVPVRAAGDGLLPTPGWTDEGRWVRFLDFDELPHAFNPPEGFVVTANNRVIGDEYPYLVTLNWDPGYRAARIRELLGAAGPFSADDFRRMQMDTVDIFARWAKELAARAAEAEGKSDLARALRAWDGTIGADRTEPTVFYGWYRTLQQLTYADELQGYAPGLPLQRWMRAGASPWFDDTRTSEREDLAALSARAMRQAIAAGDTVRWGRIHRTLSGHALGGVRLVDRLLRLNVGPTARAGGLYTVNVAEFGLRPPFLNTHAASFRQVVDLADVDRAGMIITTGQSGNPLSRRYRDQVARWWNGELWGVALARARVAGTDTLRLVAGAPGPR